MTKPFRKADQPFDRLRRLGLRRANAETNDLTPASGCDRHGDYRRDRDDAAAIVDLEVGRVETTALRRFKNYRDGLMIALLAARPFRLRNLTILDRTVVRRGDSWWIQIPAAETKTKVAIEVPWPGLLTPPLEIYLAKHRACIATSRGVRSDALWLSVHGLLMNDNAIYLRIVARTRDGLRHAVNPHLFRDCAATSVAIDDPAHIDIARCLLGSSHRVDD